MKNNEYTIKGFSSYVYNSDEKKIHDTILNKPVRINSRNGVEPHSYLINDEGKKIVVSYLDAHPYVVENKFFLHDKKSELHKVPIRNYFYLKKEFKNIYSGKEKLTFFKRLHSNKKDYQRLVLLDEKLSLLENIGITQTNIGLESPSGLELGSVVPVNIIKMHNFRNYRPKIDEVEFFLVNEINLGILI